MTLSKNAIAPKDAQKYSVHKGAATKVRVTKNYIKQNKHV